MFKLFWHVDIKNNFIFNIFINKKHFKNNHYHTFKYTRKNHPYFKALA